MSIKEELQEAVAKIVRDSWTEHDGQVVPEPEDLQLGNHAVNLRATVLYADLQGSTSLVDKWTRKFAAEVYKTYMACAARIIKHEGGSITAYDGDRVMGIFVGNRKNTDAARTSLKINWALQEIVNPAINGFYSKSPYTVRHVIGVDTSDILACRIGVRNDNDIVWVGRAANYAAKLSSTDGNFPVYITGDVFDVMLDESKFGGTPRRLMWDERQWTAMNGMRIYGSSWTWPL